MWARRCAWVLVSVLLVLLYGCGYGSEGSASNAAPSHLSRGPKPTPPLRPTPTAKPSSPPPPSPAPSSGQPERPHPQPKPSPSTERPTKPLPEPPGPEAVPYDVVYVPPDPGIISGYIGGALGAARRAQVMTALYSVNQWLRQYKMLNGRYPKDMRELQRLYRRDGGRFQPPPPHYKYFYWPKHGVVKMVRVDDPRFRDPKGIHTLKRNP